MRTLAAVSLFVAALISAAPLAAAGGVVENRRDELQGVMFATSPAEEWQSVWTDHSQSSQVRKSKVLPAHREVLQNGCEALGSIVTELGQISGRCVT